MNLRACHENWTSLAENDPMWVVLTRPDKVGGRWEREEFFKTGEVQVGEIFEHMNRVGAMPAGRARAVDFGCGLGRLSRALSFRFDKVVAIDISATMIEKAGALNADRPNIEFCLNVARQFESIGDGTCDMALTLISLQHTPSRFQLDYLTELLRILRADGVLYFNVMHARALWRRIFPEWFVELYRKAKHRGRPFIPIYPVSESRIRRAIEAAGGRIVDYNVRPVEEPYQHRLSYGTFVVQKQR